MRRLDFVHQIVSDLIAVQVHLHEAIVRQSAIEELQANADARALLAELDPFLLSQVDGLKSVLARLDLPEPKVKERVSALLGAAAGLVDKARDEREVSRDLRDDFVVLSLVLVNYGMLSAAANAIGDTVTDELASAHIDALAPLLEDLMMIVPQVVEEEVAALPPDEGA